MSISDASEAPEGASVVTGPRGGLYYVPGAVAEAADEAEGEVPGPAAVEAPEDFGPAIEAYGAERVNTYAVGDRVAVDFQLPMPGEEPPQRSSFAFYADGRVEGTLRLGILDREAAGGEHHSRSEAFTERLAAAVARAGPPEGAPVLVDFGDFHYPPRPHIRFRGVYRAGLFEEDGGVQQVVQEGEGLTASPAELFAFTQRAASEIYDEFEGEWAEGGTAPPEPPAADGAAVYDGQGDPPEPLRQAIEEGVFDGGEFSIETTPVTSAADLPDGWAARTQIPIADAPEEYGYHAATVQTSVADFKRLQERIVSEQYPDDYTPGEMDEWWAGAYDETVESVAAVLRGEAEAEGDGVPLPYIEIGANGNLRGTQEGRSRVLAAEAAGVDTIPFRVLFNDEQDGHLAGPAHAHRELADPTAAIEVDSDPLAPPEGVEMPAEELAWNAIFRGVAWDGDPDQRMLAFAPSTMPDSVQARLLDVLQSRGLFPEFEPIDDSERWKIVDEMSEAIRGGQGWTVREMAGAIQRRTTATEFEAFRIARTEMAALTNRARELYYEESGAADSALFRWVGPQDHRTTEACEWLKEQTKNGVPFDELVELEQEASAQFFPDLDFRRHVIHPFERHTYVQHYAGAGA